MMRLYVFIGAAILGLLLVGFSNALLQENEAPEVKITAPKDGYSFKWNSIVPYSIMVADQEDGYSDYDEISPTEVFLIVKYLEDPTQVRPYLDRESKQDYDPLIQMGTSTCFNCHRAKGTLIGPSFKRIANTYRGTRNATEILAQKVIEGGTLVWGDEIMPPHPDLGIAQTKKMVNWILTQNEDPNKEYLTGIEGSFKTKKTPSTNAKKGTYVLTARYTDHGTNGSMNGRKQAQSTVILKTIN